MPIFHALGHRYDVTLHSLRQVEDEAPPPPRRARGLRGRTAESATGLTRADAIAQTVARSEVLRTRIDDPLDLAVLGPAVAPAAATRGPAAAAPAPAVSRPAMTLVTQTVIVEGARQVDLAAARDYGASVLHEGYDGKALLKVDTVDRVFGLVELLRAREVGAVAPNFLRRVVRPQASAAVSAWAHRKIGVAAAWAITKGVADVRVAVLDEGVDTDHPSLKPAVVSERDFIGSNPNAMPDGDDAHGTACAGIVVSRSASAPGIAPGCSLIAVRIAMGDGNHGWIFDDFATADAIDWSWREGADVLSNSWGGGPPSDPVSRALARARTQGRHGKGAVVCIAAGNAQAPIEFPGSLPGYVTVGASTPNDERKTKTSSDGETWWGSNFGEAIRLVAPGVFIWTTDISGGHGYSPNDVTQTFNGTSAATPHVAAAAALMLSAAPNLSASTVRNLLGKSAKKIMGQTGWTRELGWGRLDVGKAVQMAKGSTGPSSAAKKTASAKTAKTPAKVKATAKTAAAKPRAKAKAKPNAKAKKTARRR